MTLYRYTALVEERRYRPVTVEVEVPDGKSPYGPNARQAVTEAVLEAPVRDWGKPSVVVRVTFAQEVEGK